MAVALDAYDATPGYGSPTTNLTCSLTIGAGASRLVIATVHWYTAAGVTINSVKFDPTGENLDLTQYGTTITQGNFNVAIYRIVNPASGAKDVQVNFSANCGAFFEASCWTGVNQTTPLSGVQSTTGASGNGVISLPAITSAVGHYVIDAITINNGTLAVGADQTVIFVDVDTSTTLDAGSSYQVGAASVVMSWDVFGEGYAYIGCNIEAAAADNNLSVSLQDPVIGGSVF